MSQFPNTLHPRAILLALLAITLTACAVSKPRTDDPWEKFNRKVYTFNSKVDKAVIRPAAVGYRKITSPNVRRLISNFFANIRMPITIGNDVLQGEAKDALKGSGRFIINTTVGFLGFFDPASQMRLPPLESDFGVTLTKWGFGEGPYLVLPLVGSTTVRDIWRMPVDSYFFDPISRYANRHEHPFGQENWPNLFFLVTLRAGGIDAENVMQGVYDPYVFYRDAYRQRRLYLIYDGEPPIGAFQQMQGIEDEDIDALLEEQQQYEKSKNEPPSR